MVCAFIMAGGQGTRMGDTGKPKQFLEIGGKTILLRSVEAFYRNPRVDSVLILTPVEWVDYTQKLLDEALPGAATQLTPVAGGNVVPKTDDVAGGRSVTVVAGGSTRNETLMNGIRFLEQSGLLDEDTCLLTHDAVRPLVTDAIIDANIDCVLAGDMCTTAVPATDTLLHTAGEPLVIDSVPNRAEYYMAQTPQSFQAMRFLRLYQELTEDERQILTDATKVFTLKGQPVSIVRGDSANMKITYAEDLAMAEALLSLRSAGSSRRP
jgi:2-C-methyl-D-erythritol 4-phosphate cytidylyltransferase